MLRDGNVSSGSLFNSDVKGMKHVRSSNGGSDKWTSKAFFDSGWENRRDSPGLKKRIRLERNGQAYDGRDPWKQNGWRPSQQLEIVLETVFGRERCENLRFALHPHLKRICLYERHREPELGRAECWRLIWICSSYPTGKAASDYGNDVELAHTGKFIGEFKHPEYEELLDIERLDKKKYGVAAVELFLHRIDMEEENAEEKRMAEHTAGFLDYYFNLARDEANQLFGSGQRMSSYATVFLKSDPKRWKREEKDGYTVVTKRASGEEGRHEYRDEVREFLELCPLNEIDLRRRETRERSKEETKLRKRIAYEAILDLEKVRVEGDTYRKLTRREAAAFFRQNTRR